MNADWVAVPVRSNALIELVDFLRKKGSDRSVSDAVEAALDYWISNAEWKTDELMPEVLERPQHRGYQWKTLLLPPGTQIRMKYKGKVFQAEVRDDDFVFEGRTTTPSEFANHVAAGTARNAWRDLWIKRPQDQAYQLADLLRRKQKSGGVS